MGSGREPRTVRLDPSVYERFVSFVIETHGQKHGHLGQELENALKEYMDRDRFARIEEQVEKNNELLTTLLSESEHTHTHGPGKSGESEMLRRCRTIVAEVSVTGQKRVVKDDEVERTIEQVAGGDERTIAKYREKLKKHGLLWEHPGDSRVWTPEKDEWLNWVDPSSDLMELSDTYPVNLDELDDAVGSDQDAEGEAEAAPS